MRFTFGLLTPVACVAALLTPAAHHLLIAAGENRAALAGQITSSEEGPMEGVLVSVKKAGSTQTITVVTDQQGRYRFPDSRLDAGEYALGVRAIGFDLESAPAVSLVAQKTTTADLKLRKARDLASQLTNAEWLASFPGSDEEKASVRGCAHCHTLELVTRSHHDAHGFVSVIERMSGYPPLAFPLMPQRTPAPRIGGGDVPRDRQLQTWQRQADYLATLNLSVGNGLAYALKTEPRPSGAATRVVYTTY